MCSQNGCQPPSDGGNIGLDMKRTIKRIAPLQAGKMMAYFMLHGGYVSADFMLAAAARLRATYKEPASSTTPGRCDGNHVRDGIFMPVIYGVMGSSSVLSAPPSTICPGWIGGIEVEVE